MAIYLIVGQPRHGKSQFAAKMAYDYHQKNLQIQKRIDSGKFDQNNDIVRQIYSDIDGHADKCDFVLNAPKDWREVPDNSIIFMDEIHQRPEYCDNNGKMSLDQMIIDLTTHGHHNKDIILMTQDPERLNKGIRKLIEKMYLVKRPIQKPPFATIYEFERWLRDPWATAASTRSIGYQDSYKFFYKKQWQEMYTSASAHTSINFKIQSKFIYAIIAIFVLMSASYFLFIKSGGDKLARNAMGGLSGQTTTTDNKLTPTEQTKNDNKAQNLDIECRKGANVEKPECVQWFNNLSKNGGSVDSNNTNQIGYNPNKPYETKLPDNYMVQVNDVPRLSGCMTLSNGQLIGIDQQGNYMQDIAQSDCKRYMSGYRPFDYSKQYQRPEQSKQRQETTFQNTQKLETPSA
jgi:hypothetical protein